jgi:hypothetical protein
MASFENIQSVNMIAGEDLRGDLHEILQIEDDSDVGKVIKATAVANTVIGMLGEDPDSAATTDGQNVPVVLLQGIVTVKAGATITAGQLIVPDVTAGRVAGVANAAALAADSMAIGVALESAVDGDIFRMLAQTIAAPHSV